MDRQSLEILTSFGDGGRQPGEFFARAHHRHRLEGQHLHDRDLRGEARPEVRVQGDGAGDHEEPGRGLAGPGRQLSGVDMAPAMAVRTRGAVALGAAALLFASAAAARGQTPRITATVQESGTDALLIAVSPVDERVVWVAGADRTILRTTDGGGTWAVHQVPIPDAPTLQFRDVHGVDADTAYALTIGSGSDSRVFKTTDGGASWRQTWVNPDSAAFWDCFDFRDAGHGLLYGDAVDGALMVLQTTDGAEHWARVRAPTLPPALPGEGGFASSGTCLVARPDGNAWASTTKARVLHTPDFGRTWTVSTTPISVTDSTGVASVSFRDGRHGMAFGGFGARPGDTLVAVTDDGSATWTTRTRTPMPGGLWGGAYVPGVEGAAVAVGSTGAAYTLDEGRTWTSIDGANYWGIGFAGPDAGWIVGRGGRIVKLSGF